MVLIPVVLSRQNAVVPFSLLSASPGSSATVLAALHPDHAPSQDLDPLPPTITTRTSQRHTPSHKGSDSPKHWTVSAACRTDNSQLPPSATTDSRPRGLAGRSPDLPIAGLALGRMTGREEPGSRRGLGWAESNSLGEGDATQAKTEDSRWVACCLPTGDAVRWKGDGGWGVREGGRGVTF